MSNTLEDSLDKALDHLIDWILGHDEEQLRNIDFRKAKNEVFYAIEPCILSQAHKIGLEAIGKDGSTTLYDDIDNSGGSYSIVGDLRSPLDFLRKEQRQRLSKITGVQE